MSKELFSKPERAPGLPWQQIADKVLLLQPSQRFAHELNPVASLIWQLADGHHEFEEIVTQVTDQFDVTPEQAKTDTLEFLNSLREQNLLL